MTSRTVGSLISGTTRPDTRGIAPNVPQWQGVRQRAGRHSASSPERHRREYAVGHPAPVASRRPPSPLEKGSHLVMRDELTGVGLRQAPLDLREEAKTLNDVLNRGVRRKLFDRVENALLQGTLNHGASGSRSRQKIAKCSVLRSPLKHRLLHRARLSLPPVTLSLLWVAASSGGPARSPDRTPSGGSAKSAPTSRRTWQDAARCRR